MFETTLAMEYADGAGDIAFQHITAPRNSCAGMLKFRRALMGIMPGYAETIAGLYIKRLDEWDQYRYVIRGNEITLGDAVGILEGRIPVPKYPPRPPRKRKITTESEQPLSLVAQVAKPATRRALPPIQGCQPPPKPLTDLPMFAGVQNAAA